MLRPADRSAGRRRQCEPQRERRSRVMTVASAGLAEGATAPDFSLPTDGGGKVSLKKLRGQPVVLYFYPKDATSGCTTEACGFRDNHPKFSRAGVTVIGI